MKIIQHGDCLDLIKSGMTMMVGGFMGVGSPHGIIETLVNSDVNELTLICNDAGLPDFGVGKMVVAKQFKHVIASHIGLNKEAGRQLTEGETKFELIPQGTLVERIRSRGVGLGGFLTPTGVGTVVEEGKEVKEIDGRKYILEMPLGADVAILYATKVDKHGNVYIEKTASNFNPMMALAAETIIVEADEIVEVGDIDPHLVMIPGGLVDYVVKGGKQS